MRLNMRATTHQPQKRFRPQHLISQLILQHQNPFHSITPTYTTNTTKASPNSKKVQKKCGKNLARLSPHTG
jgi:hypothetical protein